MFSVCVVISDLYLFQEVVLLNPCFIFSKNLILSLIDKVTTGATNFSFIFFLKCCSSRCCYHFINFFSIWINCFKCSWYISDITQFFVNFKSSSISQLINVKSRDLHKSYSNILMEQQLLCLIYYYCLVYFLLFLSYTQKIYWLLYCCLSYYYYYYYYYHFQLHHHLFHLYNNSINFLMS